MSDCSAAVETSLAWSKEEEEDEEEDAIGQLRRQNMFPDVADLHGQLFHNSHKIIL